METGLAFIRVHSFYFPTSQVPEEALSASKLMRWEEWCVTVTSACRLLV